MAVSRRLRFEILRRDGHSCRYCGAAAPDVALTVDHVIPVALGGGDDPTNLVTACQPCNAGKSSIAPDAELVADVDATAMMFARAIERAAAQRLAEEGLMEDQLGQFHDRWTDWTWTNDAGQRLCEPLPADWETTIRKFIANGLEIETIVRLSDLAQQAQWAKDTFRLFCKKCWDEIGVRQELARQFIEDGKV